MLIFKISSFLSINIGFSGQNAITGIGPPKAIFFKNQYKYMYALCHMVCSNSTSLHQLCYTRCNLSSNKRAADCPFLHVPAHSIRSVSRRNGILNLFLSLFVETCCYFVSFQNSYQVILPINTVVSLFCVRVRESFCRK